jgi:type VI secretion system secreted protein VgrG
MEAQAKRTGALARWVTGRQSYFLKVHGAPETDGLSIFSVHAVEKLGEPYRITLELTARTELKRADYLGKFAKFTIEPPILLCEPRTFDGCVMRFTRTKKTRDFCAFKVVVESTLARLNLTKATRIYQNLSAPDIIVAILKRHKFLSHQYTLKLRKPLPKLAFHMQYQMTDWAFIHLVMRQAGIFCYARTSEFGDVVTFADDVDGYVYRQDVIVPYREISGLDTGTESVYELQSHSEAIPASTRVADYNPSSAWERFAADTNLARDDKSTYGESYTYGTHHLNAIEAQWEARLRHEEALSQQIRFEGKSTNHDFFAGLVVRLDEKLPDAPHGLLMTEVVHQATREKGYFNEFKAIPCERPYRIPLDEANWPRIAGTLSARITTRHETDYAQPDENGLYTARFDFDFDAWPRWRRKRADAAGEALCRRNADGLSFPAAPRHGSRRSDCRRPSAMPVYRPYASSQSGDGPDSRARWLEYARVDSHAEQQQAATRRRARQGRRQALDRLRRQNPAQYGLSGRFQAPEKGRRL